MRHGAVAYFDDRGRPVPPDDVPLTEEGREQAAAAARMLEPAVFDRVLASGLPRTVETARIVAPEHEPEAWPELQEIRGDRLSAIPPELLEESFVHAFRGIVPLGRRFLGGILSWALTGERLFLGHFEQAPGCVNVLDVGDEWIVRAVNVAPTDLAHASTRLTTMEHYWRQYRPPAADPG
jgi:probable phosphoglycerate mutase